VSSSVRIAQPGDTPEIYRLLHGLAVYEHLEDAMTVTEEMLDQAFFGPQPLAEAFLAEVDGKAVGLATVYYTFPTFQGRRGCFLEDIFVDPAFRKQGLGKALIRAVAARAVELGCCRMEWIALDWNENALNFYKNLGAQLLPQWKILRLIEPNLSNLAE